MKIASRKSGFTLIELLMVISIIALLAAFAFPALKNFGKSNINISASRQLLDDIGRARQLAMSQRTTVYMVFVPTNFWENPPGTLNSAWWNTLPQDSRRMVTNLLDRQLSGYNFYVSGQVGDQPGQHTARYLLSSWRALPAGTFIASQKFAGANQIQNYPISRFNFTSIPFPAITNSSISLPYVAFNYLGQLTTNGTDLANGPEYVPLEHGSVLPALDSDKNMILGPADVSENPPGNSTNSTYSIVKIDALTGRATLLYQKVQ